MKIRFVLFLTLAVLTLLASADAQRAKKAAAAKSVRVDLSKEKVGGESAKFLSVVGNWIIVDDGGKNCLSVDGRQWMKGQPANGLAQKARAIYGSRHEEFIDNVKAFAYFPYAIAKDVPDFQNGEISLRFKLISGQLDSCAGILFRQRRALDVQQRQAQLCQARHGKPSPRMESMDGAEDQCSRHQPASLSQRQAAAGIYAD